MKNFDTERLARRQNVAERTFILGGSTFVLKPAVKPEILVHVSTITGGELKGQAALDLIDQFMIDVLTGADAQHEWLRIRAFEGDDLIDLSDLVNLVEWVAGQVSGRPPTPPSASSGASPTSTSGVSSTPGMPAAALISPASPTPDGSSTSPITH